MNMITKLSIGAAVIGSSILTMNIFQFMLLFWCFFAGVAAANFILRASDKVPNFLPKFSIIKENETDLATKKLCFTCGKNNCTRQKPGDEFESIQPWAGISVNEKVDKAVMEFLDILLEQRVKSWYRNLSENDAFLFELKVCLRHCLSVVYRRINRIDLPEVIISKLVRHGLIHLHACLLAQDSGCSNQDEILSSFGEKMHTALKGRRNEINYLRGICDRVFPIILPQTLVESKVAKSFLREVLASNVLLHGIDVIEDPHTINHLLQIFFDPAKPREAVTPPSQMVPFLQQFVFQDNSVNNSLLHIDLPKIMTTQDQLYQFMTFLKSMGAVHLLQFCLTVDDFNRRCLAQEQTEQQQKKLHKEAHDIYTTYCQAGQTTFIHFEPDIIKELRDIANGNWYDVSRLRTSTPLFQAYDHVYNLLEHIYCPLFYQSDIYYEMVCGKRMVPDPRRKSSQKSNGIPSTKKKTASKSGFDSTEDYDEDASAFEDKSSQLLLADDITEDFNITRDLSTWRVSIPRVAVLKPDDLARPQVERMFAYCVEVKRVNITEDDDEPTQWQVLRRYSEFYVLESKLIEFHGSLHPATLPAKRLLPKTFEYLDSKKAEFDRFLNVLVFKSAYRHSELLYDFLLPERAGAVSRFYSKLLPDVKIGRLFRGVPDKLMKEKGRHLDSFLQSFVQSCEASKPKSGNQITTDNPEIIMDEKIHNDLYPDLDYQDEFTPFYMSQCEVKDNIFLNGVCDYIVFLAVRVFNVNTWVHYVMVGFKLIFKNTIEPFFKSYLAKKIDCYRQEHHVVDLIHLFRDMLFFNKENPKSEKDKIERKTETLKQWKEFIPAQFGTLIGKDKRDEGCEKIFNILQQPKLNKQLGYVLLDAFLLKLFPELQTESSHKPVNL